MRIFIPLRISNALNNFSALLMVRGYDSMNSGVVRPSKLCINTASFTKEVKFLAFWRVYPAKDIDSCGRYVLTIKWPSTEVELEDGEVSQLVNYTEPWSSTSEQKDVLMSFQIGPKGHSGTVAWDQYLLRLGLSDSK